MKSDIIAKAKIKCEENHNVDFVTFTTSDAKNYTATVGFFPALEKPFHNGIKLVFVHETKSEKFKFMTIIFSTSFIDHYNLSLEQMLKMLVGKKIRVYKGIFEELYFDFEDQCFPNKIFKMKEN